MGLFHEKPVRGPLAESADFIFFIFLQTTLSYLEFLKKLRASDCSSSINGCDHMLLFLTEAKI